MRHITKLAAEALRSRQNFSLDNTKVKVYLGATRLYLHGNLIAKNKAGDIRFSLAGYPTNVTKERLSPFVKVTTRKGKPYANGVEIDALGWYIL